MTVPADPVPPAQERGPVAREQLAEATTRNSLFGLLGLAYPLLLSLVATPILVHKLGVAAYGVFALAALAMSFLALLDFGLAPSLVKWIAEYVAADDTASARTVVGTAVTLYVAIGGTAAAAGVLATVFAPLTALGIDPPLAHDARGAILIACVGVWFAMIASVFAAVPTALRRFDVTATVRAVGATWTAVASIAAAYASGNVEIVVLAIALEPLLRIGVYWMANRRIFPDFRPQPRWRRSTARDLITFGGAAAVANLSGFFLLYLDRIVLGAISGVRAVAYYSVVSAMSQRLHAAASSLAAIVFPTTSALVARGEIARARTLYRRATVFVALTVTAVAVPVACLARKLLALWIDPSFAAHSSTAFRLVLLAFFLLSLNVVPYYVLVGGGKPRLTVPGTVLATVLNVVLLFVLIPRFGAAGAGAAFAISVLPMCSFIPLAERAILHLERTEWKSLGLRLALLGAAQAAAVLAIGSAAASAASVVVTTALGIAALPVAARAIGLITRDDTRMLLRATGLRR